MNGWSYNTSRPIYNLLMLFKTKKYYSVSERILVDQTERPTVALNIYFIFVEEF